jgi:hypothetical protein
VTATRKPSKPWRVTLRTAGGPVNTDHRSERAAYEQINGERDAIAASTSQTTAISIRHWEDGRWRLYEDGLENLL